LVSISEINLLQDMNPFSKKNALAHIYSFEEIITEEQTVTIVEKIS